MRPAGTRGRRESGRARRERSTRQRRASTTTPAITTTTTTRMTITPSRPQTTCPPHDHPLTSASPEPRPLTDLLPRFLLAPLLMLRLLPLAAAPPPAPPRSRLGFPLSPNFSGKSRKGRPARSGGRPFLGSPGVKPNPGRRRGGGLVPSKTDHLQRTSYNGPARVEMAPEAVPLIAFQRQRRHSNLGTASGTNPANAPVLLVAHCDTRQLEQRAAPGRRKR